MRTRNVVAGLCWLFCAACEDAGVESESRAHDPSTPRNEEPTVHTEALSQDEPSSADADLMYAVEPKTGRVAREIPPVVLADVLSQLERRGMKRELEQVKSLYDLRSGRVRDTSRAERAEARVRALRMQKGGQP